jgi:uncharacterized protein
LAAVSHDWVSPKTELLPRNEARGPRLVARTAIAPDELVVAYGGQVVNREQLDRLGSAISMHSVQIDEDLFLAGEAVPGPADAVRHSCLPNLGFSGSNTLVAMRDIAAGEELTFDNAMCDTSDYDEFECTCGTAWCRHQVLGTDWMRPELQSRYAGYFTPHVVRKIATLSSMGPERRAFSA